MQKKHLEGTNYSIGNGPIISILKISSETLKKDQSSWKNISNKFISLPAMKHESTPFSNPPPPKFMQIQTFHILFIP